jgi:hypothetical protein
MVTGLLLLLLIPLAFVWMWSDRRLCRNMRHDVFWPEVFPELKKEGVALK